MLTVIYYRPRHLVRPTLTQRRRQAIMLTTSFEVAPVGTVVVNVDRRCATAAAPPSANPPFDGGGGDGGDLGIGEHRGVVSLATTALQSSWGTSTLPSSPSCAFWLLARRVSPQFTTFIITTITFLQVFLSFVQITHSLKQNQRQPI